MKSQVVSSFFSRTVVKLCAAEKRRAALLGWRAVGRVGAMSSAPAATPPHNILVTGASSGIGLALVRQILERGALLSGGGLSCARVADANLRPPRLPLLA
jgi:hypothetical protein